MSTLTENMSILCCRQRTTTCILFLYICIYQSEITNWNDLQSCVYEKYASVNHSLSILCLKKQTQPSVKPYLFMSQSHAVNTNTTLTPMVLKAPLAPLTTYTRWGLRAVLFLSEHMMMLWCQLIMLLPKQLFCHDVISSTNLSASVWHQGQNKKQQPLSDLCL